MILYIKKRHSEEGCVIRAIISVILTVVPADKLRSEKTDCDIVFPM